MNYSLRYKLSGFGFCAFICALFVWGVFSYLENDVKKHQELIAQKHLTTVDLIVVDVNTTLENLNNFNHHACDEQMLISMRRAMFRSKYIKDIGYLNDDHLLICTTGLGLLKKPILENNPDFLGKSNTKVWINRSLVFFDRQYRSFIISKGNFNAVIDPIDVHRLLPSDFTWEIVYPQESGYLHLLGTKDHFTDKKDKSDYHYQECSQSTGYCVALSLNKREFYNRYQLAIPILSIATVLLFLTCGLISNAIIKKRTSLETRIKTGLDRNHFYPLFQPIVELDTGEIVGCEVLARYKDQLGEVYPDVFIPIISKANLTWQFTESLFSKTLGYLSTTELNKNDFRVNFNFFPNDISAGTAEKIIKHPALEMIKSTIVIEIIENEKLVGSDVTSYLESLSKAGFKIAIDDFGTGYSNLQQLAKIPCDYLKIDRSFINEMEGGSIRSTLIPHIVKMAHQLNVPIVAEGVENSMQERALQEVGIKYAQGWAFGKPMTLPELIELFNRQQERE